jgi:hypothetical protein
LDSITRGKVEAHGGVAESDSLVVVTSVILRGMGVAKEKGRVLKRRPNLFLVGKSAWFDHAPRIDQYAHPRCALLTRFNPSESIQATTSLTTHENSLGNCFTNAAVSVSAMR